MRDTGEERRQEKLDLMAQQIKNGTLVIRKMTPEERELYPPRTDRRGRLRPRAAAPAQLICGRRSAHGAAASICAASE